MKIADHFTIKELTDTSYEDVLAENILYALDHFNELTRLLRSQRKKSKKKEEKNVENCVENDVENQHSQFCEPTHLCSFALVTGYY